MPEEVNTLGCLMSSQYVLQLSINKGTLAPKTYRNVSNCEKFLNISLLAMHFRSVIIDRKRRHFNVFLITAV